MAKETLFEQFNAVKQQIQGHVDEQVKQVVSVNKQEAVASTPALAPAADDNDAQADDTGDAQDDEFSIDDPDSDSSGDQDSDKKASSDKDDAKQDDLEDGLDELEDDQEDAKDKESQDKADEQAKASEESYKAFSKQALQMLEQSDSIAVGLEQIKLIDNCFDEQGDLNISQEHYSVIKNQKWVTGHQLFLSDRPPSSSSDIYYASESLKDALANIIKWIIKKIASLIEWVYDVVNKLNDTFSYDSMMDRFKSYTSGPEIKQGSIEHLIPEHNRLLELIKQLDIKHNAAHVKFSAMYQQANQNPQAMALVEKLVAINQKLIKAAKHYEAHKESTALNSTIELDKYSSILETNSIKSTADLYKVLTAGAQCSYKLREMGKQYLTLYSQLKSNESKIDSIMIASTTNSMEQYVQQNFTMFLSLLSPIIDTTKNVLKLADNYNSSQKVTEHSSAAQTYGHFSLDINRYKIYPYGQLVLQMAETDITSSNFKRIGEQVTAPIGNNQLTEFKNMFGSMYGIAVNAIKVNSEFKCFYQHKNQETYLFSAYKDPTSAAVFYDAYLKALQHVSTKDFDETIADVTNNTKKLGAELSRVQSNLKNSERKVQQFATSSVRALAIFDDKGDEAKQRLDQYLKETISNAYLQIFNYTNVVPLLHAVLCYKTSKYTIEKVVQLMADMQLAAVNVEKTYRYFIRLALVVTKQAQAMKTTAQELSAMGVDASYYLDMADEEIRQWTSVFGSIIDSKKKVT